MKKKILDLIANKLNKEIMNLTLNFSVLGLTLTSI